MEKNYLQNHLGELEEDYLQKHRDRAEELSVLNRASKIITSTSDIQRVFESFIEELGKLVDVSWAAITLVIDSDLYFLALYSKIDSPWQVGERILIKDTGAEWVVKHKTAMVESDLSQESKFVTGKRYLKQGIRAIAYLPLIANEGPIGNLTVASCKPNAYSQRHIAVLEQLASPIAVHIKQSQVYAEVREKVSLDEVTRLPTRHDLEEAIAKEIRRHSCYGGAFSLIILDVESFKALNGRDRNLLDNDLLREIGSVIESMIRRADQVFHYRKNEFAILLPNTSPDAANKVSERLRNQITSAMTARDIQITASLGLASWPSNALVANELIDAANASLHQTEGKLSAPRKPAQTE